MTGQQTIQAYGMRPVAKSVIALKLKDDAPVLDRMATPSVDPPGNPGRGGLSFMEMDFRTDPGICNVFGNTPVSGVAASVRKTRQLPVV